MHGFERYEYNNSSAYQSNFPPLTLPLPGSSPRSPSTASLSPHPRVLQRRPSSFLVFVVERRLTVSERRRGGSGYGRERSRRAEFCGSCLQREGLSGMFELSEENSETGQELSFSPAPPPAEMRRHTADVHDSCYALLPSNFAQEREGGPERAKVFSRDANDDRRRRRGEVLDCGKISREFVDSSTVTRMQTEAPASYGDLQALERNRQRTAERPSDFAGSDVPKVDAQTVPQQADQARLGQVRRRERRVGGERLAGVGVGAQSV